MTRSFARYDHNSVFSGSHVLLDTVGTEKPLGVHHMKPRARPPAHDLTAVLKVIRKVCLCWTS